MTPKQCKFFTLALLAVASIALMLPVHASASAAGVPITGAFTDASNGTGQFVGTFNPQSFGVQSGRLVVIGTLVGTMTDSTGKVLGTVANANTAIPVAPATATCSIL